MKKKILGGLISFVVLAVIIVGVCCMGFASRDTDGKWFGNFKYLSTWHWADPEEPEENISILAYALKVDEYEAYGIDPLSVTEAKSLSIDFEPTNTTDKRINWHVKFKNPNSAWASGKNALDYVQFNPAPNYGSTATIGIKQPFGETIFVEACSRSNPSLKATINIEYCAKLNEIWSGCSYTISLDEWENKTPIDLFYDISAYETNDGFPADNDGDVYTVLPDEFRGTVWFEQDEDLYNYIRDKGCDDGEGRTSERDIAELTNWKDFFDGHYNGELVDDLFIYVADSDVSEYMLIHGACLGTIYFELDYYYKGEKIGSLTTENDIELTSEFINAFAVPAQALKPNTDTVVF